MKYMDQTYGDIAGGSIDIKEIEVENITCLVHIVGFLKIMYHILNNKYLMVDADWTPKNRNLSTERFINSEKI